MKYKDFSVGEYGFAGHLIEPDKGSAVAVIVIMGGEKGILPGRKIAETFAYHGITGLAASLFGAPGLADGPDQISADMFEKAVQELKRCGNYRSICVYGMSMGSVFAVLAAKYISDIDKVILCSPTHVPFEGSPDKKHMSGHSVALWRGREVPFVNLNLSAYKAGKYYYDEETGRKVTGMWLSYRDAYKDKEQESKADLHIEELTADVLLIAGTADEMWPSDYSVHFLEKKMKDAGKTNWKVCMYKDAGHLIGVMPVRERNKWLYRAIPLIGLMYRSFRDNRETCLKALEQSQAEILKFIID